jgi:hypothetical protein
MDGPIVEEMATFLKYTPLLVAGFDFITISKNDNILFNNFSTPNDTLPIGT